MVNIDVDWIGNWHEDLSAMHKPLSDYEAIESYEWQKSRDSVASEVHKKSNLQTV